MRSQKVVRLFEESRVILAQAAKIAGVAIGEFLDHLRDAGIPAVDYSPDEPESAR